LVAGGKTLGEALTVHPELLHDYETAMIRAAEHTGSVADILLQLAAAMRRQIELKSRLKAALTYPLVLLLMSFLTIGMIAAVLVPNLLPLFESTRAVPPLIIRIFISLQANFGSLAIALAIFTAIAFAAVKRLKSNERMLEKKDRLLLRLPVIGTLVAGAETVRTAASLGLLLKSGIPLLQALSIVQHACKSRNPRWTSQCRRKGRFRSEACSRIRRIFGHAASLLPPGCSRRRSEPAGRADDANRADERNRSPAAA